MTDRSTAHASGRALDLESRLSLSRAALARNWAWLLALGILWIILGALAIVLPLAAAIAINLLLGALLVAGGIMQLAQSFRCRGWRSALPHALAGLVGLVAGVLLLFFPLAGVLSLALVLAAFFVVDGVLRIITAAQNRHLRQWGWMMFSGIVGLAAGVIVWLAWPGSAAWVLGLVVGIELIVGGWAMAMLALAANRSRDDIHSGTPGATTTG